MAVRTRGLLNRFDELKKQGLSDTAAMERAIKDSSVATAKAKKADEAKLVTKTQKRIKKLLKKGHSPAGAKFAAKQKTTAWSKPKKRKKK